MIVETKFMATFIIFNRTHTHTYNRHRRRTYASTKRRLWVNDEPSEWTDKCTVEFYANHATFWKQHVKLHSSKMADSF